MMSPWNKGKTLPAEPLSVAELHRLLGQCSQRAPTGIRNAAAIVAMWRGGLRCSEMLALQPKDLDQSACTIRILHGKGDRHRVVGLDPAGWLWILRWLDARRSLGLNGRQPVFCTLKGKSMSDRYIRLLLKRLGEKAGIEKRVHPHGLRHTHAVELVAEGFSLLEISQQLGHASTATTDRYLQHLAPAQRIERITRRRMVMGDESLYG